MDDQTIRVLTCSCGAVTKTPYHSNVGVTMRATGWGVVLTHGGHIVYLCPKCTQEAAALAARIAQIVGHDDPYMPGLKKQLDNNKEVRMSKIVSVYFVEGNLIGRRTFNGEPRVGDVFLASFKHGDLHLEDVLVTVVRRRWTVDCQLDVIVDYE